MYYSRWATSEEMKKMLTVVNKNNEVTKAGLPMMYDEENIYVNDKEAHSLVIGSVGSGKTQVAILPVCKLAIKAGESLFINDVKGEVYNSLASQLDKDGYNTIIINTDDPNYGNCWNPLSLPYGLYKEGEKDKALEMIEEVAYYIFSEPSSSSDPFWTNSTIDYFTGLTLYLFENAKEEEINLNSIFALANKMNSEKDKEGVEFKKKVMDNLDVNSNIYINLSGTVFAPKETAGSILSVFNQKIKTCVSRDKLSQMMAKTNFDIKSIGTKKTAIFVIGKNTKYTNFIVPMLVNQVYHVIDMYGTKEKTFNILLDDFEVMLPIYSFVERMNYSRGIKIKYTVIIKSYMDLKNTYGVEQSEMIKASFGNIVYLLSNDNYTLESISDLCGRQLLDKETNMTGPLITVEELRVLQPFEAVILVPRMMPFKTKLLPDYQIMDWNFDTTMKEMPRNNLGEIKIFDLV